MQGLSNGWLISMRFVVVTSSKDWLISTFECCVYCIMHTKNSTVVFGGNGSEGLGWILKNLIGCSRPTCIGNKYARRQNTDDRNRPKRQERELGGRRALKKKRLFKFLIFYGIQPWSKPCSYRLYRAPRTT